VFRQHVGGEAAQNGHHHFFWKVETQLTTAVYCVVCDPVVASLARSVLRPFALSSRNCVRRRA